MSHKSELCRYDSAIEHGLIASLISNHPGNEKSSKSIFHLTHLGTERRAQQGLQLIFVRVTKHFAFVRYTINIKVNFIYYALRCKRGLNSTGRQPISFPGVHFSLPLSDGLWQALRQYSRDVLKRAQRKEDARYLPLPTEQVFFNTILSLSLSLEQAT